MNSSNLNWCLEYYEQNHEDCNKILNSLEDFEQIPLINALPFQNFTDGTLVRYRGMIQDMLNPEYYPNTYTVVVKDSDESFERPGKFRDISFCKANEEVKIKETNASFNERMVYFCVPLPGTNDWVCNLEKNKNIPEKNEEVSSGVKREMNESDEEMEVDDSASPANIKKNKVSDENKSGSFNILHSNAKYFPLPCENGLPCIIKVYEENLDLLLNERIEVIGFLSLNPALEATWEDRNIEDIALHPPPSLVPRIHVVVIKRIKHNNPLLKQVIPHGDIKPIIETARNDLKLILTQMLFEDTVAADYVLCHLLSRIYIRDDTNTIGKFSLNLFNIKSKNFGTYFNSIIKKLVTNSHFVSLSINFLNETSFIPKKDYESSRLHSGILQLCDDTHLILDETKMNEGQLNNNGCLNVTALQRLFREQVVQYDFGFYPVSYNTNIPLIVLSEGKSMFEADIQLKVKTESSTDLSLNESFEAVNLYLNEEVSNNIRVYLTAMRLENFELGEEMMRKIGEDYVSMRQSDNQINSSDLHTLLILSRLLALSHGRSVLNPEDWTRAVEMETERKSRTK